MIRPTAYWGFIVLGAGGTILGPALLSILATYHMPDSAASILFVAGTIGYTLAVLIGGPASDRFGKRRVMIGGTAAYVVGLCGFALAPSWLLAVVAMFVSGVGSGTIDSGMNALVNDISAPEGHATEQSLLHSFFGLGALLGPLLIGAFLALHGGWRPAYLVVAAGSALLLGMLARLHVPAREVPAGGVNLRSVLLLARNRLMIVLTLLIGIYVGAELLLGDWLEAYLQRSIHMDKVGASNSVSLYWGGLMVGRLLSAVLSRYLSATAILFGTTALALVSSIVLVLTSSMPVALIALTGCGLGFSAIFPLVMALAGERFPESTGSVAGLLTGAASLGGAIFPALSGVLAQAFGVRAALAVAPPCAVCMLVLLLILARER